MIPELPGGVIDWTAGGLSVGIGIYIARLFGNGCRWLVEYFTGRLDQQQRHNDEVAQRQFDRLEREISNLTDRVEKAETALLECNRKHAESEAKVMRLEATLQGYGDARQQAAVIVAAEKKGAKE